jgi:hypothetical protein
MKRALLTALQASVTICLLWWIFRDPAKNREMLTALQSAGWWWLVFGVLAIGLACVFQTERWRQLLAVQGIALGWWRTFRVYMIGAFFNLFLLGATGGDVVKIYYAMRETASRKSAAFLSVLVDRMMGLLGLVAIAALAIGVRWSELTAHPLTRGLLGTVGAITGFMVGLVVVGFVVDRFGLSGRIPRWLPLHAKIVEFATAFSVYARGGRVLASTFALSLGAHVCNFLAFFFAARAFNQFPGLPGLLDISAVIPIIMVLAALPISLSGVGLREALFQKMFAVMFGTPAAIAVMISVTGFLMTVFWGLVGGAIYLLYRPSGGLDLSDVKEQVADVEREIEDK